MTKSDIIKRVYSGRVTAILVIQSFKTMTRTIWLKQTTQLPNSTSQASGDMLPYQSSRMLFKSIVRIARFWIFPSYCYQYFRDFQWSCQCYLGKVLRTTGFSGRLSIVILLPSSFIIHPCTGIDRHPDSSRSGIEPVNFCKVLFSDPSSRRHRCFRRLWDRCDGCVHVLDRFSALNYRKSNLLVYC